MKRPKQFMLARFAINKFAAWRIYQERLAIALNKKQHGDLLPVRAILLSLLLLLSFSTVAVAASSGTCGENLTWVLDDAGTLTISGTGEMTDYATSYYASNPSPWYDNTENIVSVDISAGVTSIGNSAFYSCTNLSSISIPEGVTRIGNDAFLSCRSLTNIDIPNSVTSIGSSAFSSCAITSMSIPYGVTSIEASAFQECGYLTSIDIPNSVTSIGNYAFGNCQALTNITIPGSVVSIHNFAFRWCYGLKSIIIPEGVTSIGYGAFTECRALSSVTLPSTLTTLDTNAFIGTSTITDVALADSMSLSLSSLPFKNTVTYHANSNSDTANQLHALKKVFKDKTTGEMHTDAVLPAVAPTCTETGLTEGAQCSVCGYVTTPQEIAPALGHDWHDATYTWSEDNASVTATHICKRDEAHTETETANVTTEVTKPATCETDGETTYFAAFTNTTFATQSKVVANIPPTGHDWGAPVYTWAEDNSTVTASRMCRKDAKHVEAETVNTVSDVITPATYDDDGLVTFTATFTNSAFAIQNKSAIIPKQVPFEYKIVNGQVTILSYTGSDTTLIIPSTINSHPVTSISDYAFVKCSNLTSVTIPDSVTSIGRGAFRGCNLTSVTIPNTVISIEEQLFQYCSSLSSITIPDSVTSIGYQAFDGCRNLTAVNIPSSVSYIGDYAFNNCPAEKYCAINTNGSKILSKNGFSFIDPQYPGLYLKYIFTGDEITNFSIVDADQSLTDVIIPNGITSIDTASFSGCSRLSSVIIPDSVTSIASSAFQNCSSLTSINIPDSVTSIGSSAFYRCSSLSSVTIPASVTSIGSEAFYECSNLTSVSIPDSLTSIDLNTFYRCTSLISVTIPGSVASIGPNAFYQCSSLTSVIILNSVSSIGSNAFYQCSSLTSVTIPDSVISIGPNAFNYCSSLTSITIPVSVTSIAEYSFSSCSNLTSISIPDSVTAIGSHAFSFCIGLKSVSLPSSLSTLDSTAFFNCSSLKDVILPDSMLFQVSSLPFAESITYHANGNTDTANQLHELNKTFLDKTTGEEHILSTLPALAPTCTDTGLTEGAQCAVCGYLSTAQHTVPALGHNWNEPTYIWADDNSTVTASHICKHDETHIETETATVTAEITKPATCEALGETTYSASFTNEAFKQQSKTLNDIPATGHDWGEVTYTWADDNQSVTASRVCSHDASHTEAETATVTAMVSKPATCEVAGETTYSAAFTNTAFEAQSKTLADIPATGHDWGDVTYTWAEDNKSITASRVCSHDGSHIETETATVSATVTKPATCEVAGETTYSASFTNAAFEAQSKTLADIPATGHDWGEITYAWAEDNKSVTASRVCKHDETHTETETATVTATVTKPATCEVAGETTYSAAFTSTAFAPQSKILADIPATGHDWGDVTYTWADDNKSVTASRVCSHDGSHTETETATVTAEVTKPATCEVAGETTYSATFANTAFTAQSKTLADIPALGHTPVFTPGKLPTANTPGHTAGSTCSVCGKVLADHLPVESVQTLALPVALRTVADSAFARTAADHVLLPAGATAIGPRAFADAPNLRFVTVPDSVNSIAPDAFEGCSLLTFFCSDSSAAAAYAEAHGFAHTAP